MSSQTLSPMPNTGFSTDAESRSRPVRDAFYRHRRRIATALVAVIALVVGYRVVSGANGMMVYQRKRAEYRQLQRKVELTKQENDRLRKQNDALTREPAAIEREAREQLHYTRPGEVIYVQPPPPELEHPADPTRAQK